MTQPTPSELAAAAELRNLQSPQPQASAAQLLQEHERRQAFRRLIDPGIMRPNSKEQAIASLKTLLAIAENILKDPSNLKYQQFKPTNSLIKRNLVDPKGALEYAIELGFRPEVIKFQPYYTFNKKYMNDLRIGAAIIHETLDIEIQKLERVAKAKSAEKAAAQAVAEKVKLAFIDDRKSKLLRDQMEKETREAREQARQARIAAAAEKAVLDQAHDSDHIEADDDSSMPGSGHVLGSKGDEAVTTSDEI